MSDMHKWYWMAKDLENFAALARVYSEHIVEVLPELSDALANLEEYE